MEKRALQQQENEGEGDLPPKRFKSDGIHVPDDVWERILSFLHYEAMYTTLLVSTNWFHYSTSPSIWRSLCEQHFGEQLKEEADSNTKEKLFWFKYFSARITQASVPTRAGNYQRTNNFMDDGPSNFQFNWITLTKLDIIASSLIVHDRMIFVIFKSAELPLHSKYPPSLFPNSNPKRKGLQMNLEPGLLCLEMNLKVKWHTPLDVLHTSTASIAVNNIQQQLVVSLPSHLYGIDPQSGSILWKHKYNAPAISSLVVLRDAAFVVCQSKESAIVINGYDIRNPTKIKQVLSILVGFENSEVSLSLPEISLEGNNIILEAKRKDFAHAKTTRRVSTGRKKIELASLVEPKNAPQVCFIVANIAHQSFTHINVPGTGSPVEFTLINNLILHREDTPLGLHLRGTSYNSSAGWIREKYGSDTFLSRASIGFIDGQQVALATCCFSVSVVAKDINTGVELWGINHHLSFEEYKEKGEEKVEEEEEEQEQEEEEEEGEKQEEQKREENEEEEGGEDDEEKEQPEGRKEKGEDDEEKEQSEGREEKEEEEEKGEQQEGEEEGGEEEEEGGEEEEEGGEEEEDGGDEEGDMLPFFTHHLKDYESGLFTPIITKQFIYVLGAHYNEEGEPILIVMCIDIHTKQVLYLQNTDVLLEMDKPDISTFYVCGEAIIAATNNLIVVIKNKNK